MQMLVLWYNLQLAGHLTDNTTLQPCKGGETWNSLNVSQTNTNHGMKKLGTPCSLQTLLL